MYIEDISAVELPPFVKSLKEGWQASLQAAAVVVGY